MSHPDRLLEELSQTDRPSPSMWGDLRQLILLGVSVVLAFGIGFLVHDKATRPTVNFQVTEKMVQEALQSVDITAQFEKIVKPVVDSHMRAMIFDIFDGISEAEAKELVESLGERYHEKLIMDLAAELSEEIDADMVTSAAESVVVERYSRVIESANSGKILKDVVYNAVEKRLGTPSGKDTLERVTSEAIEVISGPSIQRYASEYMNSDIEGFTTTHVESEYAEFIKKRTTDSLPPVVQSLVVHAVDSRMQDQAINGSIEDSAITHYRAHVNQLANKAMEEHQSDIELSSATRVLENYVFNDESLKLGLAEKSEDEAIKWLATNGKTETQAAFNKSLNAYTLEIDLRTYSAPVLWSFFKENELTYKESVDNSIKLWSDTLVAGRLELRAAPIIDSAITDVKASTFEKALEDRVTQTVDTENLTPRIRAELARQYKTRIDDDLLAIDRNDFYTETVRPAVRELIRNEDNLRTLESIVQSESLDHVDLHAPRIAANKIKTSAKAYMAEKADGLLSAELEAETEQLVWACRIMAQNMR